MDYEKLYKDLANDNGYYLELKGPDGKKTIYTYWTKKDFIQGLKMCEAFDNPIIDMYHIGTYKQ